MIKSLKQQYATHLHAVQSDPDHNLGGPQIGMTLRFLEYIKENHKDGKIEEGSEALKLIQTTMEEFQAMDQEHAMEMAPLFKVQKAYAKKGKPKLMKLKLKPWPVEQL